MAWSRPVPVSVCILGSPLRVWGTSQAWVELCEAGTGTVYRGHKGDRAVIDVNGHNFSNRSAWTLLVVPCSWTHLPAQGMQVQSLLQEDPTCHGATKLVPQLISLWSRAQELQLLKLLPLDPVLHKRSHFNEKPAHHKENRPQLRN